MFGARTLPAVLIVALMAGACAAEQPEPTVPPSTVATTSTTVVPTTIPPLVEVTVGLDEAGYLVDSEGRSLYLFTLDDQRTSTCEGACAQAWPPFLGDPVAGAGVDAALLGKAERPNGSVQVTYGGSPLYLYSGDGAPGETNGHAFNDVWFLVSPGGGAFEG